VVLLADVRSGRLLPVTSADHGLVPGGVCLPADGDLRAVAAVARHSGPVDLTPWDALGNDVVTHQRLTVAVDRIDAASAAAIGAFASALSTAGNGPMSSRPQRRAARTLAAAAITDDLLACHRHLGELVGAGPGSTPAGDDVVLGVLAAFDRAGARADRAAALLRRALPSFWHRTTATSRHDLVAAVGGEFAERVHALLHALSEHRRVLPAVQQARTWGASSGLDLAAGVAAGALSTVGRSVVGHSVVGHSVVGHSVVPAPLAPPTVPASRTDAFTRPATDRRSA